MSHTSIVEAADKIFAIEAFYARARKGVRRFNAFVVTSHWHLVGNTFADHISYKCGSSESFEAIRAFFESTECSKYIYQTIISGRRIACIRLVRPFRTALGQIYYLELSDQKPDGSQMEGFDHIEVHPVGRCTYEQMVEELSKTCDVRHVERPHHTTDDIDIGDFVFRCTRERLIAKIIRDEISAPLR